MPREVTVNRFVKGLNSDLSLNDRPQEVFLDGHNIRLARREGGTFYAANLRGQEQVFELTDGFIPIGSEEFDGYLFILSYNPTSGLSEIGSFPAPVVTGGIQRVYRPLQNYTTDDYVAQIGEDCLLPNLANLGDFRTDKLGFRCDKPARVKVRLDFDGSVNIYWTDDNLPWRVINNGFNLKTGAPNGRYITEGMITSGFINGINESDKHPIVDMTAVVTGGSLRVGNYFFFVRYTDLNFLTTSFLGQSGPVPVFNTVTLGSAVTFGGEAVNVTDKAVELQVSNLDTTVGFFEIGYIRYYGQDIFEAFLIDKRYSIGGLASVPVRITGNEPLVSITLDELVGYKPSDAVYCKDLTQLQNQLFIANTRGPVLDHPDLRRFMCALSLGESYDNNGPAPEIRNDQNQNPYGTDANDTEERLSYYSGETYIFSAIPVFKGGFVGLPYPLQGFDNYLGTLTNANHAGIYRFRKSHIAPFFDGTDTFIKAVTVTTTGAALIYAASAWLQENLIGVYIARGDRNKNLLYQGLSLRCYNGLLRSNISNANISLGIYQSTGNVVPASPIIWQPNPEDWATERAIPLFEPAAYSMVNKRENPLNPALGAVENNSYFYYASPEDIVQRNDFTHLQRLGIFCTDYYIDKVNVPDSVYVQLVGTTSYGNDWRRESTASNPLPVNNRNALAGYLTTETAPQPLGFEWFSVLGNPAIPGPNQGTAQTFVGYNQKGINYQVDGFQGSATNIVGWNVVPNNGFSSRMDEGKIASQDGLFYYQRNIAVTNAAQYEISLPFALPDYIGINGAPTYNAPYNGATYDHYQDKWNRAIVNVCRSNPDALNYIDLYDFKNTEFYPIGSFQKISDFLATSTHKYYRGDCVIARQYLKLVNGSIENLSEHFINVMTNVEGSGITPPAGNGAQAQEDLLRGYGHWISIVTEMSFNANYRHELGRNLFYPKTNPLEPGKDFAWLTDAPESYFFNKGYAEYLGPRAGVGIDLLQPVSDNVFPTRIRPSIKHIFGAVRDGYRQFIPADAKDFDYKYGEIQAIATSFDNLYSFQNTCINLHPINERVTTQGTQGSTALLGQSVGLTEYRQMIKTEYGTQHRFGVIQANQALYCLDWNMRAIMRILGAQVELLDVSKGIQTWLRDIIALGSTGYSDRLESFPNEHPCGRGVHGIYNRKFKEVVWTLRMGEQVRTIVFSEEMDCFLGTHGYKPIHYGQIREDLYSFQASAAWRHDCSDKYDTFYGVKDIWRIKAVVNANAEITKHWDNIILTSNNRVFSAIRYETQHQTAEQKPFLPVQDFWYAPTYRENEWRLPIRRADNVKEPELSIYDDFGVDKTPLRGRYLVVELEYDGDKELWLREIITFYTPSKV